MKEHTIYTSMLPVPSSLSPEPYTRFTAPQQLRESSHSSSRFKYTPRSTFIGAYPLINFSFYPLPTYPSSLTPNVGTVTSCARTSCMVFAGWRPLVPGLITRLCCSGAQLLVGVLALCHGTRRRGMWQSATFTRICTTSLPQNETFIPVPLPLKLHWELIAASVRELRWPLCRAVLDVCMVLIVTD